MVSAVVPEYIKANPYYFSIYKRVHLNKGNFIIVITGKHRTGKSTTALRIANDLDIDYLGNRRFNISKVASTHKEFMDLINASDTIGECFVWDEAGMTANARTFYQSFQIKLAQAFQVLGFKRHIAIITLPSEFMLDKQIRMLAHSTIQMNSLNVPKGYSTARVEYNSFMRKGNRVESIGTFPRIYETIGSSVKVRKFIFRAPPIELLQAYEKKMNAIKERWISEISADATESAPSTNAEGFFESAEDVLHRLQSQPELYWDDEKNRPRRYTILSKGTMANGKKLSSTMVNNIVGLWKEEYKNGEWNSD